MKTHVTNSGDEWDLVACIAYGQHVGDDLLMHHVIEANLDHLLIKILSANLRLTIPNVARTVSAPPLIPWT
jgi:hypothetical protein